MRNHRALLRLLRIVIVCLLILTTALTAQQQQIKRPTSHTQVVLLGTGNPPADLDRSGTATAIVVNGTPYLVDFGGHRATRKGRCRRQRNHRVGADESPGCLCDPSTLGSHGWLPGSDSNPLGAWTARSARSLRPCRNQGHD